MSFAGEYWPLVKKLEKGFVDRGATVFLRQFHRKPVGKTFGPSVSPNVRFLDKIIRANSIHILYGKGLVAVRVDIAKLEAEKRQDEFILHIRVDDRLIVGFPDVVS